MRRVVGWVPVTEGSQAMPRERSSSGQSSTGSEYFETLRDIGRNWIERVSAEAERGSRLSKD